MAAWHDDDRHADTLAQVARENEAATQTATAAFDALDNTMHSVHADLRPDPTEHEDHARLQAWLEDLNSPDGLYREIADTRQVDGVGTAGEAARHEHLARLARCVAMREDWVADILRRQAEREDVRLAAQDGGA
jgi:hypothetical protein